MQFIIFEIFTRNCCYYYNEFYLYIRYRKKYVKCNKYFFIDKNYIIDINYIKLYHKNG